jgi:capsular exopolysaccharide synthesis family protein
MGYIFDALNRAQPPEEHPRRGSEDSPEIAGDRTATMDPPPQASSQDASSSAPDDAEPQTQSDPQAHAPVAEQPSPRNDASIDIHHDDASTTQEVAVYANTQAGFPDDFDNLDASIAQEHDEDDDGDGDGPATLGAIEPIRCDRHIELNERRLKKMDDRIVMLTEPGSQFAEEYRSIRTSLLARWQNKRNLSHVITSATPQEGKTITSLNLGLTLAELRSRRTIIVEADLRLPAFAKLLKLEDGPGLVNYLRGEVTLEEATQRVGDDGAYLLAAGDRAFDDAVSLLSSSRMQALLEHLRQRFDHVVIDTPPVIELADAGVLGGLSDEVLLIARMRRTSSRLIDQAIQTLGSYNAPVGGVIATDHRTGFGRYYAYRYHYRYRYGYHSRYHDYRKSRKAA